jgi:hypothetical protein
VRQFGPPGRNVARNSGASLPGNPVAVDRHPGDTRYAPRYDERRFRSIKPGATAAEVVTLLGEPLSRRNWGDGTTIWYYSDPGPSQNYFVRVLIFSPEDRVIARKADCYLD